jgi:hypothetical protein
MNTCKLKGYFLDVINLILKHFKPFLIAMATFITIVVGIMGIYDHINIPKKDIIIKTIIIDPGHGGKDPGVIVNHEINGISVSLQEKDITLQLAKLLKRKTKEKFPKMRVVLTRSKDIYQPLETRVDGTVKYLSQI